MSVAIFKGKLVKFLAKAGILVPTRTELERPDTPAAGEMAFNTDSNALEVYNGSSWAGVESSVTKPLLPPTDPFSSTSFLKESFVSSTLSSANVYATDASSSIYVAGIGAAIPTNDLFNFNAFYINSNTGVPQNLKLCFDSNVNASCIVGTSAYFAGEFTSFNGQYAPGIAKVSLTTGLLDATFMSGVGTGFGGTPKTMVYDDISNNIIIAGSFYSWNGAFVNTILAINRNSGALDATFMSNVGSGFDQSVELMIYSEGGIYCAGFFSSFNGTTRNKLAKLNYNGQLIASFDPGTSHNGTVYGLKMGGQYSGVYVCGTFTSYNGTSVGRVIRLDSSTAALDTSFLPSISSTVHDVQPIGADVFIGGSFSSVNGVSKQYIAKLSGQNATLDSGFPTGTSFNNTVNKLSERPDPSNQIIALGSFSSYGGSNFGGIVSLNTSTGAPLPGFNASTGFTSIVNRSYSSIGYSGSDSNILVTGRLQNYENINNWRVCKVCKLNVNGTINTSFNPNILGGAVSSLELDGLGSLYIGGDFTSVNGVSRTKLAKISAIDGSLDTTFVVGSGPSSAPRVLKVDTVNGVLYLAGGFTSYNGTTSNYIAAVNASTGTLDSGFSGYGGTSSSVLSMVIDSNQDIYLGGSFNTYGSDSCPKLVKIDKTGARITTFDTTVTFPNSTVYSMALDNSGNLFIGGGFTTYGGTSALRLAKLNATTAALDTNFYSFGTFNSTVEALAFDQQSNSLYVGGDFSYYGDALVVRAAKLNASNGALDTSFNSGSGFSLKITSFTFTDYGLIASTISFGALALYNNQFLNLIYVDKQTSDVITAITLPYINYTLQQSDSNTAFLINTSAASTITIPAGLPVGTKFKAIQLGSGSITVLGAGSVVVNNSGGITSTSAQYGSLEVTSYAADTYLLTVQ